jgi:hypothetical protein
MFPTSTAAVALSALVTTLCWDAANKNCEKNLDRGGLEAAVFFGTEFTL